MSKKKTPTNSKNTKNRKTSNSARLKRRRYSDDDRRAAVRDVAELGLSSAARKHDVPTSTLHAWTRSSQWLGPQEETVGATSDSPARGRRFTVEERRNALELVANGMSRTDAVRATGTTPESIRRWTKDAQRNGTMPTLTNPHRTSIANGD